MTLDTAINNTINNKKDNEGKQQGGTYNLSCKVCNCKSHHYTGQTDDLMSTLKELPNSLSRSLKTQQRRSSNEEGRCLYKSVLVIDESVSSNTENTDASSADFLSSPFAKHPRIFGRIGLVCDVRRGTADLLPRKPRRH